VLSFLERAKAELGLNQKQIAIIEKVRKLVGSSSPAFRRDSVGKRIRPIHSREVKQSTKRVQ
jgi:hypothetical protein